MSKDFITIDVRKPEYKVLREAFEGWAAEGFFGREVSEEDLKYTLFKLGFGDIVKTYLAEKEYTPELPYEEDPIVPVPSHPIEEEVDSGLANISRVPDHHGPKY